MTAQPVDPVPVLNTGDYEVIDRGGQALVLVPLADFARLQLLERQASAEQVEEAQIQADLAAYRAWVAAGRPGARSHAEAMAELLGDGS